MRFDAQDGSVFLLHYEVLDANGVVIPRAISGDMDTGLVKRAEVGPNGELIRQGNKIKTLVERHPAPLYLRKVRKSVQETSQQFDWQPFIDNQFMWTEKSDEDTQEADTQPSNS